MYTKGSFHSKHVRQIVLKVKTLASKTDCASVDC